MTGHSHMHAMTGRAAQVWACLLLPWLFMKTNGKIPDVHVTCQVSEDCLLPCSFEPSGSEKILWYRQDVLIYSHPDSSGQHNEESVDRTSMFTEQLDLGNASLLLQQCGPQNRGCYRCRVINGDKEKSSFIVVKVEAPIRSVNLKMTRLSGYEEVKCSTSDVYPAPQVSWSTDPSTPPEKLKYTTRMMADKLGRYSMESKLRRLDHSDLTYICTVNSSSTHQTWRAFLTVTVLNNITSTSTSYTSRTWADMNPAERQNLTIPCKAPWDSQDFTLTWSFTRENRTTDVCTYDSRTDLITNQWKSTAFLEHQGLKKGDASIRLVNLRSLEHTGVYICNISAFQRAHVGQIEVNITSLAFGNKSNLMESATQWWIPVIALALLAILAALIIGMVKLRGNCRPSKNTGNTRDSRDTKVTVSDSEDPSEGIRLTAHQNSEHT